MTVLVANGSFSWHVEKNLPNAIQAGDWFNLAFRWRIDKGVQLFINSELQEEIPFAVPMEEAQTPADNKMYVGCRNHELTLKDFADYEMDELALWNKYMPDHKIIDFTGAISKP
ncbi:uncharacterized protein [Watersipora subatra]|uniref:uncharacterized protein n=1 Tax=Watersipora subatra TaxID=2589382 RepID=UPI00355C8FA0